MNLLAGCRTGPDVQWVVVDPTGFAYKTGKRRKTVIKTIPKESAKNFSCIHPDDIYRGMSACKQGEGFSSITYCAWSKKDSYFGCSDDSVRGWNELENWACLGPIDWLSVLEYCKRKKEKQ